MKRTTLLTATLLATTLTLPLSVQAKGWQILPVTKPGYKADTAVAVVGGVMQAKDDNKDIFSPMGLEVSINCPLLKAPNHTIRQRISYLQSDTNGFKTQAFELNPHHMYKVAPNVTAGFGPSVGYTKVENSAGNDGVFTFGVGASGRYDLPKNMFIGAEARFVKAQEFEIAGKKTGFDNARALVKFGYQF